MVHLISLQAIIKDSENLLTLPDIWLRLRRMIDDDHCSADDMATLISRDPSLSAQLLKLVNSPLYYFPRTISSISQAITLIGSKQLYALVTAASTGAIIRSAAGRHIELKSLWKHSLYTAFGTTLLAEEMKQSADTFFLSGLLCNIGTLAVVTYAPDIALAAVGYHCKNQFPWDREKEVLGFTMAEAGGALLDAWNLPFDIVTPVLFQHTPGKSAEYTANCHALHCASRIALEILQSNGQDTLDYLSVINDDSLSAIGHPRNTLDALVKQITARAPEMLDIFTM
ncbi:HDOD domain-containing protein [Desulfogranum japonicum]|uniref:HDOD domain-containing protein n=1 Tax=Desulfogranum japonicum TaxID=231447 RepID=UPI00068656A9|nr:HDOD domain-containing protein [Desulfogranum japonicum]